MLRDAYELMKLLPIGTEAVKFELKDIFGNIVALDDFLGKYLVVLEFGSFT
jgi:peroxiredoxin